MGTERKLLVLLKQNSKANLSVFSSRIPAARDCPAITLNSSTSLGWDLAQEKPALGLAVLLWVNVALQRAPSSLST